MRILRKTCNQDNGTTNPAQALDLRAVVFCWFGAQGRTLARFVEQESISWSERNTALRNLRNTCRALFDPGKNKSSLDMFGQMQREAEDHRRENETAAGRLCHLFGMRKKFLSSAGLYLTGPASMFNEMQSDMASSKSNYKNLPILWQRIQGISKSIWHQVLLSSMRGKFENKASYWSSSQWLSGPDKRSGLSDNLRTYTSGSESQRTYFGTQVCYGK
jgi:hypothetical protein